MMKKIIAIFLIVVNLFSMLLLGGCSENVTLTMGQWLTLVDDAFGMTSYTEEKPFFENVGKENGYFSVFQAAAEWEVIKPSASITPETPLKWKDVLISLVNAGEFLDLNCTDEEKIDYAVKNFGSGIRKYWSNRYISLKDAAPLLDEAQEKWAGKKITKNIQKSKFSDQVEDHVNDKNYDYTIKDNFVTMPASQAESLNIGEVYTLPANSQGGASINKVKSINIVDGKAIIENDDSFDENEAAKYVEEIVIQETTTPDFTKITGIYDANGNPLNANVVPKPQNSPNNDKPVAIPLANVGDFNDSYIQTGLFDGISTDLSFEYKSWKITLSFSKDDFGVELSKTLSGSEHKNRFRAESTQMFVKTTFDDVSLTKDIDFSWGVLHSATLKLDYKTTIEGGIKTKRTTDVGKADKGKNIGSSLKSIISGYKGALSKINTDVRNTKYADDEIYICKFSLADAALASVDFVVKGKVAASGELKIVIELEGAQGLQYKNKKIRHIKSDGVDINFVANGKVEVTVGPGFEITLLKKWCLIDLSLDVGAGVAFTTTAHLFDAEGHELYSGETMLTIMDAEDLEKEELYTTAEDIKAYAEEKAGTWNNYQAGASVKLLKGVCFEWKLYPILRFGCTGKSLINELAKKFEVELSIEFLGSKNTLIKGHIDGFSNLKNAAEADSIGEGILDLLGVGAECTYDYKPWDDALEEIKEIDGGDEKDTSILTGDTLSISTMRMFLQKEESQLLSVTMIPKGYELKDIKAESENKNIADIDLKTGLVTAGKKEGTTQIKIYTSDNKYKVYCAVTVIDKNVVEFEALDVLL